MVLCCFIVFCYWFVQGLPGVAQGNTSSHRRLGAGHWLGHVDRLGQERLNVRLAASLDHIIVGLSRVEVGAAALGVGLAAIRPEDGVGRHTLGPHRRLGLGLGVSGNPLLVVAHLLLTDDPLGGLLGVAADAAGLVLERTGLGVVVEEPTLVELVLLEAVGRGLISLLSLDDAGDLLGGRLRLQGSHILLVQDVAPHAVAMYHGLVELLDELGRQVLAANEGVGRALDGEAGVVAAVADDIDGETHGGWLVVGWS